MNLVRPSFAIIGAVVAMLTTSPAASDEFTDCARGFAAIARGFDDIAIHYCSQVLRSPRFSEAQKSRALDFRAAIGMPGLVDSHAGGGGTTNSRLQRLIRAGNLAQFHRNGCQIHRGYR